MIKLHWLSLLLWASLFVAVLVTWSRKYEERDIEFQREMVKLDSTLKKRESDYYLLTLQHKELMRTLDLELDRLDSIESKMKKLDYKTWQRYYGQLPSYSQR
jgi:hypothetical protein